MSTGIASELVWLKKVLCFSGMHPTASIMASKCGSSSLANLGNAAKKEE